MIDGFEQITYDLTDAEYKLIPMFFKGFKNHIGEEKAISNKQIREMFAKKNIKIGDPRVRKIINFLRRERIITGLISSSKGYWVELDPLKVKKYRESLIQRANEIYAVADSLSDFVEEPPEKHFKLEKFKEFAVKIGNKLLEIITTEG